MLLVKSQQRSNTSRIKPSIANSLLSWKSWYMGSMALLFMAPNVMFLTFIPLFIESLLLTDPMVSESEARIFSVFLSTLPYILGSLGLLATSEALTNIKRNSRLLVGMAVLLAAEVLFATFYLGYTAGISWGIAHVSFLAAFTSCFQLPLDSLVALYNQDEGVAGTFAVHTTLKNIGGAVGPVLLSGLLLVYSIGTSVAILGTVFLVPLAVLYASFLIGLGDRSGKLYDAPLSPTRPLKHDEDGPGLYA